MKLERVTTKGGRYRSSKPDQFGPDRRFSTRPTKNAVGMAHTRARSGHPIEDRQGNIRDSARMSIYGTLDRVGAKLRARRTVETKTVYRLKK